MKELKYSYESLQKFCNENSIELCRDYSTEIVRRETKIEGKCNNDGCNELFNKVFRELNQNMTPYCVKCTYDKALEKRKRTSLKKYGVEHSLQNTTIREKAKNTLFLNYSVEHPTHSKEIRDKIKETNLKKWGVEYPSQSDIIKNKMIETCYKNSGYNYPMQNKKTREKSKQTLFQHYSVEHPTHSKEIRDKIKETNLKKWGVEYILQNEVVKQKGIETSLIKYGVKNPIQNPLIAEKALNGYKSKKYVFPSGKHIFIQGYEHLALDELINKEYISENDIVTGTKNVPTIWYKTDDGKDHRHYVDIFIPTQNRCIEVKSNWTIKYTTSNIFLKQNAAKNLGYKYEIWVYNKKREKISCYN
jgi:hypothetical protein